MIYTTKELLSRGETQYSIRCKLSRGELFLVECGLYSDNDSPFFTETCIFKKYPHAILTGISAFVFYDLTDFVPDKYYVATLQHSFPIRRKEVSQSYQEDPYFEAGSIVVESDSGPVRIYDLERTLIELFRMSDKYPNELYIEVLRNFRERKDEIDFYKLNQYLTLFRNGTHLAKRIREAI